MFQISNARKIGELSFQTAKGRPVTLHPGKGRMFEVDELNAGILRILVGKGSYYKVRADSEEAEALIQEAKNYKGKKGGSPIVHGSTEPADFSDVVSVKDQKNPQPQKQEGVFIREEKTDETPQKHPPDAPPAPIPQPAPLAPEKSALELLIENALTLPFGDLRTQAKEQLGDDFPAGSPGRPLIIATLKAKLTQPVAPQEGE